MLKDSKTMGSTKRPQSFRLLLAWLSLVLVPALSFILLFEFLLDSSEKHIKENAKLKLMGEMENFKESLSCEALLENKQNKVAKKLGFRSYKDDESSVQIFAELNASKIRARVEKELGLRVFATFYHGPDTKNIDYSIMPEIEKEFLVSKTMLKNLFFSINNQHEKVAAIKANKIRKFSETEQRRIQARGEAFIKALFQTAGEFRFESGEIKVALSGKSKLRRIYFFYSGAELSQGANKANLGGFITIIREMDVPLNKIVEFATQANQGSAFQRGFSSTSYKTRKEFNVHSNYISRIVENDEKVSVLTTLPARLLNRLTCGFTYYPIHMEKILSKFPFLKVSVLKSKLSHPFRKFQKAVRAICLIASLFATVIFLRIFFFGFQFPLRIRAKIMSAVLAASILPFSALWMMSGYHENFRKEFRQTEILQYLTKQMQEFNISLSSFRTSIENQNAEFNGALQELEENEVTPFISRWMKKMPIVNIAYRINGKDEIIALSDKDKLSNFELEMKDFLFTAVENSSQPKNNKNGENNGSVGIFKFQLKGFGSFMSDNGLIHNSSFTNINALYALVPVLRKNFRKEGIYLILLLKFSSKLLLRDILNAEPKFINDIEKAGFRFRTCYIPLSNSTELPPRSEFVHGENFPVEETIEKARKILLNRSEETWVTTRNGKLQIIQANFSHGLQCILLTVADEINSDHFSILPHPIVLGIYLLGVILVVVLIMGRVFVEPVRLLQASAEDVASGNFNGQIELNSGDEFSLLSQSFNGMIQGLSEREKLSSFVSESVLSEVSEHQDSILLPGGEKTEVSVVFCSLPDLKKLSPKEDSSKILTCLGELIDMADEISRKYNGIIDKIIEDTVMIVFRQSDAGNTHVLSACKASLEIASIFPTANCPMRTASGIASGSAVSGKIGSRDGKLDYTVIGNPVNLAARLKAQAWMADQTGVLLCPQTIRMLKGAGKVRFIDRIEIKGRTRTFPMYELLSMRK